MKGTVKTLRFFAWPLAQMLGIATLFYFGTLVLGGLTKMVIFSDYAISFCFLYGIFLYISFWQFSAAYSQLALSFGATRQSIRRASARAACGAKHCPECSPRTYSRGSAGIR